MNYVIILSIFVSPRKFSRNIALYMIEPVTDLGRHSYSLFELSVPLMAVLELYPQLADLHEGKNLRDPLDDEGGWILLI